MFALIITIISIALVAALALATIYYGGTAFNRGTAEAKASQLINEGQQINGAVALAQADIDRDGLTDVVTAATLISGNYLSQMPAGWTLADAAGVDTVGTSKKAFYALRDASAVGSAALEQISKKAGVVSTVDGVFATAESATNAAGTAAVLAADTGANLGLPTAAAPAQVYGVIATVTGSTIAGNVFYKI